MKQRMGACTSRSRVFDALVIAVLAVMSPACTASGAETSGNEDVVRIRRVPGPGYTSLIVENRRHYDVTVALTITGNNASITRVLPETAVYSGHSQIEAARVGQADPNEAWRWQCSFHWTLGSMNARHDEQTIYALPFEKGKSYLVTQGYNGKLSHRDHDRYAVDFAMREGTMVCAAREGVVVDLKKSSRAGGPDEKYKDQSNYVRIAHADGTIGEYCHLKHDGVLVAIGQRVRAGQPIARSGNTGYSTRPHLHFGVYSAQDAKRRQSHPIVFTTREGLVAEPLEGKTYTAK